MGKFEISQGNESTLKCACGNEIRNVVPHLQACAKWICRACVKKGLPKTIQEQLGGAVHYCKSCQVELTEDNAYGLKTSRRPYLCKGCEKVEQNKKRKKVA